MNKIAKTSTIFLVVFLVLLLSLTAITMFFFHKERELRKIAETTAENLQQEKTSLTGQLEESTGKNVLFEEKLKEADEKINSLLDDIDLEKALKEEIKKENLTFKTDIDSLSEEKNKFQKETIDLRGKSLGLEKELLTSKELREELSEKLKKAREEIGSLQESADATKVELDKIVITPGDALSLSELGDESPDIVFSLVEGKVLKINKENNFIIIDLGEEENLKNDMIIDIFREELLLGQAKVTRVQATMSVADVLLPLVTSKIKVSDRVVAK